MKRSLTLEILEHLIVCGSSLMLTGLLVPYNQGLGRSIRNIERQAASCPHDFSHRSSATVSVMLSRLKQRGLIARRPGKKAAWFITTRGKRHFKDVGVEHSLPPEDGKVRLVIYDIPEDMASQRVWLRHKLLECDYRYLQKSVWLGTRPLPKGLRTELKERRIFSHVHVVGLEGALP